MGVRCWRLSCVLMHFVGDEDALLRSCRLLRILTWDGNANLFKTPVIFAELAVANEM